MKAALTGATGFVGGHLARALVARGDSVTAIVRTPAKADALRALGCRLVGTAASITEASRLAAEHKPDFALLDANLSGESSVPLASALIADGVRVAFCTGYEDLDYSSEFASCTAVRKPATALQIVRALREVVRASHPQAMPLPAS